MRLEREFFVPTATSIATLTPTRLKNISSVHTIRRPPQTGMEFNSNQEKHMAQRKILIIFTGGTIASVKSENGLVPGLNAPQILELIQEITADI